MTSTIETIAGHVGKDGLSFSGDKTGLKVICGLLDRESASASVDNDTQKKYMVAAIMVLAAKYHWDTSAMIAATQGEADDESDKWEARHRRDEMFKAMVEVYFWQKLLDGQ